MKLDRTMSSQLTQLFLAILFISQVTTFIKLFSPSSAFSLGSQNGAKTAVLCHHQRNDTSDQLFCEANNFIPQAGEAVIERTAKNTRRFSIRREDICPQSLLEGVPTSPCETVDDLLYAISNGERRWDDDVETRGLTLREKEDHPSSFVPSRCYIPYFSPEEICRVLNRFSHVVIQGDSLSRHLQGGFLMALRDNYINGSIVSSNEQMYKCACDAQFSEHPACRLNNGMYNLYHPYRLGLCPNLEVEGQYESVFNINRLHKGVYKFHGVDCTLPNSRGILVIVQGGVHLSFNAQSTYARLISPFFQDPKFRLCAEHGKAMFIWSSYTAQSPDYDDKYPLQKLSRGLKFNGEMAKIFRRERVNVTTIDWLNFTVGAMHSDGLHYAAQVNLFKAQHLVALVDLLLKEKRFFSLPPAN